MTSKKNISSERIAILIDGSNFYYKLRSAEIGQRDTLHFNFRGFSEWLAHKRRIVSAGYFVGVVRAKEDNPKGQLLRREQQKLFSHLTSKAQGFSVKRGYLMESGGRYHEKGVDVQLAVDLLQGAYKNTYDTAVLVSSDTDLIPAIAAVKELGKKVEYIGFSHQPSLALQRHATLSRLLIKEELEPFTANSLL